MLSVGLCFLRVYYLVGEIKDEALNHLRSTGSYEGKIRELSSIKEDIRIVEMSGNRLPED